MCGCKIGVYIMTTSTAVWDIKNVPNQEELLRKAVVKEGITLNLQLRNSALTKTFSVVIEKIYPESGNGSTGHWIFETTNGHTGYIHTYGECGYISEK